MANFLTRIFGSRNQRLLRQYSKVVNKINGLEEELQGLSDAQLSAKTDEFKARVENGETLEEILDVCADLRSVGCEMITLGQYLQPTPEHLPVERYVPPEEFDEIGDLVRQLGFAMVASGPFVRSCYRAGEMAEGLEA